MKYDKPFKTYEELITLMESRNISVQDHEFAKHALSNFSYYTLINGYKNTFQLDSDSEKFYDGVTIELLYTIHLIDSSLNNILFKYILYIEKSFKTKLSYIVGRDYGIHTNSKYDKKDRSDYLHTSHYQSSPKRYNTLKSLRNAYENCRKNTSTEYYKLNKNHVPPWILINDISLGLSIQWYNILKPKVKEEVCNELIATHELTSEDKKEFFKNAIYLLKDFRNGIAHGNKTFAYKVENNIPKRQTLILGSDLISDSEFNKISSNEVGLFSAIISILLLLADERLIFRFGMDLYSLISPYAAQYDFAGKDLYKVFRLPNDFFNRINNYLKNKNLPSLNRFQ
ncbi:Abi-like protein [Pseudoramibacter alactolyticus ATCC 23263]|uniref:Abi-like protein n=1 Tax=Pseudoramibacter alactolyticus ATCC 23263 TaxID=887929 RepID=E6MH10_9FIRM|nr:Abi family protein [Pseudoramibacter alactolyticus]EFV01900.1 Abi-like protein [Pseudoramibacter alactolyticus ATCC 23263]